MASLPAARPTLTASGPGAIAAPYLLPPPAPIDSLPDRPERSAQRRGELAAPARMR